MDTQIYFDKINKYISIIELQNASRYLIKLKGFNDNATHIEKNGLVNFINSGFLDPSI